MIQKLNAIDEARRTFLVKLLAAGAFALGTSRTALAELFGKVVEMLPAGKSIYTLTGTVQLNGNTATTDTVIKASDRIETGAGSNVIFVVGQDAFLLRETSSLQLGSDDGKVINTLRMVTGKLLSVFGKSAHEITTSTAIIGIRGTGMYIESASDLTYYCNCYGLAELQAAGDPAQHETIKTRHHDSPRYILDASAGNMRIRPAPFKNHTDEELQIIEALVGRVPPFVLPGDAYATPRRTDY